jgi:hypothetical protein
MARMESFQVQDGKYRADTEIPLGGNDTVAINSLKFRSLLNKFQILIVSGARLSQNPGLDKNSF